MEQKKRPKVPPPPNASPGEGARDQGPETHLPTGDLDPLVWVPRALLEAMFRMEEAPLRVMLFLCLADQTVSQPPARLRRDVIAAGSGIGESRVQQALDVWEQQGWVKREEGGEWCLTIGNPAPVPLLGPLRGDSTETKEEEADSQGDQDARGGAG